MVKRASPASALLKKRSGERDNDSGAGFSNKILGTNVHADRRAHLRKANACGPHLEQLLHYLSTRSSKCWFHYNGIEVVKRYQNRPSKYQYESSDAE